MEKIIFGIDLDGYVPPSGGESGPGMAWCGPMRMMDIMEKRLGLSRPLPPQCERVVGAKAAMEAYYRSGGEFAAGSFERDSLGVAAKLLQWRDELVMAGWDGCAPLRSVSKRMEALTELNSQLEAAHCCSDGDRLHGIIHALEVEGRPSGIARPELMDDPELLPFMWRRLLKILGGRYRSDDLNEFMGCESSSDLGNFQRALLDSSVRGIEFANDGSLLIVSSRSEPVLARIAARMAMRDPSTVLVSGANAHLIDQAIHEMGKPTAGIDNPSRSRGIPQVLGLALRLLWKPLDPRHLMEFLLHPACPVIGSLRRALIMSLMRAAGVGGPEWLAHIAMAHKIINVGMAHDPGKRDEKLERVDRDLEWWIECERYDRREPAPADAFAVQADRVAVWAAARRNRWDVNERDAELFIALQSGASQLSRLLRSMGTITPAQLDRLMDHVLGDGCDSSAHLEQLGHPRVARSPGSVLEPADSIVWWDATDPPHYAPPWATDAERSELARAGIFLPGAESRLQLQSGAWLRPVMAARKSLTFILPSERAGEPLLQHPLVSRLKALLGSADLPVWNADRDPDSPRWKPWLTRQLPAARVPVSRRWWRISPELLQSVSSRDSESFSSLEKFIYSPVQWVLSHAAGISPGWLSTHQLRCDPRLFGNLLHRLVERMVSNEPDEGLDWQKANPADVRSWVTGQWDRLLTQEGAQLLLPGHQSENARLHSEAVAALTHLVQCWQQWDLVGVEANVRPDTRKFEDRSINGFIDLVLTNREGRKAVLDLKYGGQSDKQRQIENGCPLQLAVYSHLIAGRAQGQDWPPAAFYILSRQRLLTRQEDFFTGVTGLTAKEGSASMAGIWEEFRTIWKWRQQQLQDGWIEVPGGSPDPDPDFDFEACPSGEIPLLNWEPSESVEKYSDFNILTGFPSDS